MERTEKDFSSYWSRLRQVLWRFQHPSRFSPVKSKIIGKRLTRALTHHVDVGLSADSVSSFSACFPLLASVLQGSMGIEPSHQLLQSMFCVGGWSVNHMPGVDWPPVGILLLNHGKGGSRHSSLHQKFSLIQGVLSHHCSSGTRVSEIKFHEC